MSKAFVNALALALIQLDVNEMGLDVAEAVEFAQKFYDENPELFGTLGPVLDMGNRGMPLAVAPERRQRPPTIDDLEADEWLKATSKGHV